MDQAPSGCLVDCVHGYIFYDTPVPMLLFPVGTSGNRKIVLDLFNHYFWLNKPDRILTPLWSGCGCLFGWVIGLFTPWHTHVYVCVVFCGEFDPGSGRTLAACLTHASRTMKPCLQGGLVANG
ncbi:hypothetical protein [Corynebacterium efficiens YS-314]|uniref:Uncharacterized protein n=1 Tax=Corynebacterium efficiens (strain DSM 44549 / YS-314 / AJ 12310 / JCM 11189 / NBRC 100395) TaxID=196164 RepID=Q8FR76_COREF|nr:hypothetical protein [Corynebacterium efficiens YS-314]